MGNGDRPEVPPSLPPCPTSFAGRALGNGVDGLWGGGDGVARGRGT